MTHICHLFDRSADWEQSIAVEQCLDRLAPDQHTQHIVSLDQIKPDRDATIQALAHSNVHRIPIRFGLAISAAPALKRFLNHRNINLINAWGLSAAETASAAANPDTIIIVHIFDPRISKTDARKLRIFAESPRFGIACASQTVRRRLIESAIPVEKTVVIRPGVDFGRINKAKRRRDEIRNRLHLKPDHHLLLASYPIRTDSGHDRMAWSGQMRNHMDTSYHMVIFGSGPEVRHLRTISDGMPFADSIHWVGGEWQYEELIAVADTFIITPQADVPTTAISWAMAASVPVIGSAVYAIAELIAHRQNGLLIKPTQGPDMSIRITRAMLNADGIRQRCEAARGQAYQAFGVRRYIDQKMKLYTNIESGNPPDKDIIDSAMDV